VTLGSSM